MTTLGERKNAGKPRFDLLPWHEFDAIAVDYGVEAVFGSLKVWWAGRPYPAAFSIPQRQIRGIAAVLTASVESGKYAARNWEKGLLFSGIFSSAARHANAYLAGDLLDEESGLPHESHFWCNILFLVVFTARGRTDLDDRPDPVASVRAKLTQLERLTAEFADMAAEYGPDAGDTTPPEESN